VSWEQIREGMTVFDPTGRDVGHVETLADGHFFLTRDTKIPLVRERIVVDAETSVSSVGGDGVHLRHDRQELLLMNSRPRDSKSSHQVAPGEDVSSVHRGDEDHRPLDHDDHRAQRDSGDDGADVSPMS
jgi:hypothetical protein